MARKKAAQSRGPRGERGAIGKTGPRGPRGRPGRNATEHVTRAEFDAALAAINDNLHTMQVQFRRIADIQAEIDALKQTITRLSKP